MALDVADRHEDHNGGSIDRSRRSVLATSSVILAGAIGVPIGGANEHDEEFDDERREEWEEDEILTLFELVLEDEGIDVAELEVEEDDELEMDVLSLEYYPLGTTEEEIMEEMGYITGVFAEAVEFGLEVERLQATALDIFDEPVSQWYVETEWAEAYNVGVMTADELALEALLTLEPVEE